MAAAANGAPGCGRRHWCSETAASRPLHPLPRLKPSKATAAPPRGLVLDVDPVVVRSAGSLAELLLSPRAGAVRNPIAVHCAGVSRLASPTVEPPARTEGWRSTDPWLLAGGHRQDVALERLDNARRPRQWWSS